MDELTLKELWQQAVTGHGEPDARLTVLKNQQGRDHSHERANDNHHLEPPICPQMGEGVGYGRVHCFRVVTGEGGVFGHSQEHHGHADERGGVLVARDDSGH